MGKLIFTSFGVNMKVGRKLLTRKLTKDTDLENKKIFVFQEPYISLESCILNALTTMGFREENIYFSSRRGSEAVLYEDELLYIYVGEGNTFQLMHLLRMKGLIDPIREAFKRGATYIGCSAGAMIAGEDIEVVGEFDHNDVGLKDMTALKLMPNAIVIPHYSKSELARYINNSPGIRQKYHAIYSVDDKGILVFDSFK